MAVTVTFGSPEYAIDRIKAARATSNTPLDVPAFIAAGNQLNEIRIPVTLSEGVHAVSRADLKIEHVSGDEIYGAAFSVLGSGGTQWSVVVNIPPKKEGIFSISVSGTVRTEASPGTVTTTSSAILLVQYNTNLPEVVGGDVSSVLTAGNNNFIYFDMDQVCVGLRQQSFDYGGIVDDASMSTLEAADAETRPAENASDWEAYNDNTLPRKFYRIRFDLPNPLPPVSYTHLTLPTICSV